MRSIYSKMRSCGKNGSFIIRQQYQMITSWANYTRASQSACIRRQIACVQWNKTQHVLHCQIHVLLLARWQPRSDTLLKTCLVVRQIAASKCDIAKDVSCCSPDCSLEVLHCKRRVLWFVRWQARSIALPNTSLLFARWHPRTVTLQKCVILFARWPRSVRLPKTCLVVRQMAASKSERFRTS